jgi:PAS domain S-box-containing protein
MNVTPFAQCSDQVERAVRESERRYRRLLASVTDYVFSVTVDQGRAAATSHGPGCEAVTGFTAGELEADPYLWFRMVHEEDRPAVTERAERILRGESPPPLEHRIVRKDGTIRWIRNTAVPRKDEQGRLVMYDGLVSDITERKQAELALCQSQERLALVIQGSNDGIWDWNLATDEVYFSPRSKDMLGYREDEVENHFSAWERLLHPEDRQRVLARLQACRSGATPNFEVEHRLRHKDGTFRWILARGVALRGAAGKPIRMAGSLVDMTSRKRGEEQLQEAYAALSQRQTELKRTLQELTAAHEELKTAQLQLIQAAKLESVGTLAAGVAHEVKNPLQTILMGLDYLSGSPAASNKNTKLVLSDMHDAVTRAHGIIQELLQLSAQRGFELKKEDLNLLLERSLSLLQNELVASQASVVRKLGADLPPVRIDRGKMEQVFINLFLNALQAMSQGGALTISSRLDSFSGDLDVIESARPRFHRGDPVVVVEVQDTGSGIPEEHLQRIFDPFFTTKPVGVGTGLGLSVVKNIVDLHGGAIGVRNAPEGGVRVTVVLKAEPRQDSI